MKQGYLSAYIPGEIEGDGSGRILGKAVPMRFWDLLKRLSPVMGKGLNGSEFLAEAIAW